MKHRESNKMKHRESNKMKNLSISLLAMSTAITFSNNVAAESTSERITLDEIVVTAQRKESGLSKTPISIDVIGAEMLSKRAIMSEVDLQTALPGLTVKAGQTANTLIFSLRGQTVDAFSSSRSSVLPYINEVQIGGGASKSGASAGAFFDIESIQVLKGPQGTLFGRNSTGGAVLFTTVKPNNEFGGYFKLGGGNFNTAQFEGALNVPIVSDKVLARVAANVQDKNGYQMNLLNNTRLGDMTRKSIRLSLTFNITENLTNDLMIEYGKSEGTNITSVGVNAFLPENDTALVPGSLFFSPLLDTVLGAGAWDAYLAAHPGTNPGGLIAAVAEQAKNPFQVRMDSPNFHRSETIVVTNTTTYTIDENKTVKAIIGYGYNDYGNAAEYDGTEFTLDNGTQVVGDISQFSAELQLQGLAFNGQLDYVTGLFYSNETEETIGETEVFGVEPFITAVHPRGQGIVKNKTIAGYAQGTLDLSEIIGLEGLGFTLGGRYSKEDVSLLHNGTDVWVISPPPAGAVFTNPLSDTFKQFSWTVGLQYQANDQFLLYANSRRSFRSGGFNFYAPPIAGFGNDGGAEYEEERATDLEIGAKYVGAIGEMPFRLNAAIYKMWVKNIQRSDYVTLFGQLAGITVNVPKAEIKGFELDGEIKPTNWWSLGGGLNYTDAKFTDSAVSVLQGPAVNFGPYPDSPKWSGTVFTEFTAPVGDDYEVSLRGDIYAQSEMYYSSTASTLNPGARIDGYHVVNLSLALEDVVRGWTLRGHIKNLTNKTYFLGGIGFKSLLAVNTALPASPRTYLVELGYKF